MNQFCNIIFLLLVILFPVTSLAQSTGLSGFDLHLFRPPADGTGILNLHGSETLEPWKFRLGMVTEASHGLLAATNPVSGQSIRVMKRTQVANLDIDDMITYGGGFAWTLPFAQRGTDLIGEVDGTTVVRNPRKLTSPTAGRRRCGMPWSIGGSSKRT